MLKKSSNLSVKILYKKHRVYNSQIKVTIFVILRIGCRPNTINAAILEPSEYSVFIFIIWLGVISSNMDNSVLGNNKSYLPLLSNIIEGRKPVLLVIFPDSCYFPKAHKCFHSVLTNQLQAYIWVHEGSNRQHFCNPLLCNRKQWKIVFVIYLDRIVHIWAKYIITWLFFNWPSYVLCKHVFSLGPTALGEEYMFTGHILRSIQK